MHTRPLVPITIVLWQIRRKWGQTPQHPDESVSLHRDRERRRTVQETGNIHLSVCHHGHATPFGARKDPIMSGKLIQNRTQLPLQQVDICSLFCTGLCLGHCLPVVHTSRLHRPVPKETHRHVILLLCSDTKAVCLEVCYASMTNRDINVEVYSICNSSTLPNWTVNKASLIEQNIFFHNGFVTQADQACIHLSHLHMKHLKRKTPLSTLGHKTSIQQLLLLQPKCSFSCSHSPFF